MYSKGSGTIWNGRCTHCNIQVRETNDLRSSKGHECGELLFCDTCWNNFPSHIQQRCIDEKQFNENPEE